MPFRRRSSRTLAALTAVLALAGSLAACTNDLPGKGSTGASSGSQSSSGTPSSSGSSGPQQPPARFTDCSALFNFDAIDFPPGRRERLTFSCARIRVPLDYAKPDGNTISLELIKVHDKKNTDSVGSLLVNPGGPGGSGVELAVGLAIQMSDRLLGRFDLIGFDPRGVGLSSPIRCISDDRKDEILASNVDVRTAAGFTKAKDLATSVATECRAKYGAELAQYNTVNTARDMDRIRQAVGDKQLNYLGFSYGTELGSQYAHLFPSTIRVAVLDGAVNPLTDDITSFANQLKGFEGSFDQFAADCAKRSPCKTLSNPRKVVDDLVKQADREPLKSSKSGESRTATGAIVLTGVLSALYASSQWPALAEALIDARGGDAKGLFELADRYNERSDDGTYSNIYEANTTIACNDSKPGPTDETVRTTAAEWATKYPMFGIWAAQSLFSCQSWQPERTVPPLPTAATPTKVLVIGNLNDPATPYQGAKDLAKTMGNAEVLTWDGEGHTSYLQGSTCIDRYVEKYLIDGALPPPATTCPR